MAAEVASENEAEERCAWALLRALVSVKVLCPLAVAPASALAKLPLILGFDSSSALILISLRFSSCTLLNTWTLKPPLPAVTRSAWSRDMSNGCAEAAPIAAKVAIAVESTSAFIVTPPCLL